MDPRLLRDRGLRRALAVPVVLGLLAAASVVVQAVALGRLIASAMPGAAPLDRPAAFGWLAGAVLVRGGVAAAGELFAVRAAGTVKARLRERLLSSAFTAAPGGVDAGELATLAGRGLDALDVYIGRCLPDLLLAAAVPAGLAAAIGWFDWVSALTVATAVLLFPVFGALVGRASASLAGARWRQIAAFGTQIGDTFDGLVTLKAFGRSRAQRERLAQAERALRDSAMSALRVAFLSALVLDTLASVSVALVAVPLGLRLLDGSVHLAAALAVLIIAPEVFLPLRRASAEFHESLEGLAAAGQALDRIEAQAPPAPSRPAGRLPAAPAGNPAHVPVALRGVRVDLPGRPEPVLAGASLAIAPGEIVVLVGSNGAGKSTVLALLAGLRQPSAGMVAVGGQDLAGLDLDSWRRRLAYLPERPALLPDTLAANLRIAAPDAADGELRAALGAVGAADLPERLPEGLQTRLGAGGRPVSAGERQRIGLARLILRGAPLCLLDEPTVHLDAAAEATVVAALRRALSGRSALIVTHRPAVASLGHRVLTLRGGRFAPTSFGAPIAPAAPAAPAAPGAAALPRPGDAARVPA